MVVKRTSAAVRRRDGLRHCPVNQQCGASEPGEVADAKVLCVRRSIFCGAAVDLA
jgi:hypothetical protein